MSNRENDNLYLEAVLQKYDPSNFEVTKAEANFKPVIGAFAKEYLHDIIVMGSIVQHTSVRKGNEKTDLDLLVSLHPWTTDDYSLKEIYFKLFDYLKEKGYKPKMRNISIRVNWNQTNIDFAPAIQEKMGSDFHKVYSRKKDIELISNPKLHIDMVKSSGRKDEIKLLKIWSYQNKLDWESFYQTLVTIQATEGLPQNELSDNFRWVLKYLESQFLYVDFKDPANEKDSISSHCAESEKKKVVKAAKEALAKDSWEEVLT